MTKHKSGQGPRYTKHRRPVRVVYFEAHDSREIVIKREKQLKGWSRKKKKALINGKIN